MTPEKRFENQIKAWFHRVGIYPAGCPNHKMKTGMVGWSSKIWGGGYQKSGIPDIIACVNGIFVAVEVKSATGTPSELQKINIERINGSGGIGVVLWPDGFDDFKAIVRGVIACDSHTVELTHLKDVHSSTKCDTLTK